MKLTGIPVSRKLVFGRQAAFDHRLESSAAFQERQIDPADGTISLFGNNDLSLALKIGIVLLVNFFAKDEHHQISILLDRSRLSQIGKLRTMISTPALRRTAQL